MARPSPNQLGGIAKEPPISERAPLRSHMRVACSYAVIGPKGENMKAERVQRDERWWSARQACSHGIGKEHCLCLSSVSSYIPRYCTSNPCMGNTSKRLTVTANTYK